MNKQQMIDAVKNLQESGLPAATTKAVVTQVVTAAMAWMVGTALARTYVDPKIAEMQAAYDKYEELNNK